MTLKTLEIEFIDIPGLSISVRPKVECRGKNLFETQLYADNDFDVFDSPEINTIAYFARPENPNAEWIKQQAEKLKVKREAVENAYANLHEDIWEKYWVESGEILALSPYSKRIINSKLNRKSKKPVLLRGYEISHAEDIVDERTGWKTAVKEGDYVIKGGKVIEVYWPRKDEFITKNLIKLLNAREDTYVWTHLDPEFYEGLRTLIWGFGLHGGLRSRPHLHSEWHPWGQDFEVGFLLGRRDRRFIKISRTIYQKLIELGDKIGSLGKEINW